MTSLVHAISRPSKLRGHLSAYLAGVGATGALTAGAVVVFLSLATFVAFRGLPSLTGSSDSSGAAYLTSNTGSPQAAAAALDAARAAVAKDPVPLSRSAGGSFDQGSGAPGSAGGQSSAGNRSDGSGGPATGGSSGAAAPTAPGVVPSAPSAPSVPSVPGTVDPPSVDAPSVPDPPSVPSTPSIPSSPHVPSTSGAVRDVDRAAGTNLSGTTGGVTRTVDGVLAGALG
jgi:hypothetical protein